MSTTPNAEFSALRHKDTKQWGGLSPFKAKLTTLEQPYLLPAGLDWQSFRKLFEEAPYDEEQFSAAEREGELVPIFLYTEKPQPQTCPGYPEDEMVAFARAFVQMYDGGPVPSEEEVLDYLNSDWASDERNPRFAEAIRHAQP